MGYLVPKILSAEFLKSAEFPADFPRLPGPEFAFAGRSNVGKSSLINTLLHRKKLAKTSTTPGRTRLLNFFRINGRVTFVDLPGYGYAKVPLSVRERFVRMIAAYLEVREDLRTVVLILDVRRDPTAEDLDFIRAVRHYGRDLLLVATKVDKCGRNEVSRRLQRIAACLETDEILPFSSLTRQGRLELLHALEGRIHTP
ncbi:MAG: YihA family ribosome biogenesis GTP-binding protein [Deltaproteobacteria bacterium]|nr:MAG: YihA family ribosome biogenesis GTP-binding protein [Deltaproteobacteria bacterium]